MRRVAWLAVVVATCIATWSLAGDIQVSCEAGLRVYLDGKGAGTSSAKEDGLFLANVPAGTHLVRVEKDGYLAQSFEVVVAKLPLEVKVEPFVAQPAAPAPAQLAQTKAKAATGTLLVTSAPQNCAVTLDGKPGSKSTPVLRFEDLAAGEHAIAFSKPGYDRLAGVVKVQPGATRTVRGDLTTGKLESVYEGKGSLRLYSTPDRCTVRLLGMTKEKTQAVLNLTFLPAGEHQLALTCRGRELATSIVITAGQRTVVTANAMLGDQPFVVFYEPE
jgi:hypothetical protein